MTPILSDLVDEGVRLVDAAAAAGIQMKLIGGVAVALSCPQALTRPELARGYKDLDFVAARKHSRAVRDLLAAEGYEANPRFNALHGSSRLLFYDQANGRQLDVFLGTFDMCHKLELEKHILLPGRTLPAADLLLLKLQVVHLNEKDMTDALALILQHEPSKSDEGEGISATYIAEVCANDWGWYTSFSDNLVAAEKHAPAVLTRAADVGTVADRIGKILGVLEVAPKSMSWKMRARIGRRMRWYELPEEVEG